MTGISSHGIRIDDSNPEEENIIFDTFESDLFENRRIENSGGYVDGSIVQKPQVFLGQDESSCCDMERHEVGFWFDSPDELRDFAKIIEKHADILEKRLEAFGEIERKWRDEGRVLCLKDKREGKGK